MRALVGIPSSTFTFFFNNSNNQIISITRNKEKKYNKIFMVAKSRLNSIDTLVSQALSDMEISHEEFVTILKGQKNMRG